MKRYGDTTWTINIGKFVYDGASPKAERFSLDYNGDEEGAYALARDFSNLLKKTVNGKPVIYVISENGIDSFEVGNP